MTLTFDAIEPLILALSLKKVPINDRIYFRISFLNVCVCYKKKPRLYTVIPRLTKIIPSGITFISRNVMLSGVSLLAVSNLNNPVGLVDLPYVMWSAHFFVTHIQTEKISSWNGPTVHVCCFMLARASTKTFVSRIHIR